jgi:hypothetical protein
VEVRTVPIELPEPKKPPLPLPDPIEFAEIEFRALKPGESLNEEVFVASPEDVERLSLNLAEIVRWAQDAMDQLTYYRDELTDEQ